VLPHGVEFGSANWVSIGAMSAGELYSGNQSIAGLSGRSATSLTLGGAKVWARNSINRRFYLLDNPQAFCVVNNELRFYSNLTRTDANVNTGGDSDLLAKQVNAPPLSSHFTLSPLSENRNTLVFIDISFVSGGESVEFQQQVMIRNVP
jgi:MSHA biogenesis protein MshO